MAISLRRYAAPRDYAPLYRHNFQQVDGTQDDPLFQELVAGLGRASGLPDRLVWLDIKSYLMRNHEFYPHRLAPKAANALAPFYFLLRSGPWAGREVPRADVIIDDMCNDPIETLYTPELKTLLDGMASCLLHDVSRTQGPGLLTRLRHLPGFLRAQRTCRAIRRRHGIDLRQYLVSFFKKFLAGRFLKDRCGAKLVVSGNDNDFPFILAKAAGARILLIQNGMRHMGGHFCFRHADVYVSMGDVPLAAASGFQGSDFAEIKSLGSIRVHAYRAGRPLPRPAYDLLWVSTWEPESNHEWSVRWAHWFSREAELEAARLLHEFADRSDLRIAYHCRYDEELKDLEAHGIGSSRVTHLTNRQQHVYESVLMSDTVLSPLSTVSLEALALGKKAGFVNLSGNELVNYGFRDLGLEYGAGRDASFASFVARIRAQDGVPPPRVAQDPDMVASIAAAAKKLLSAA